MLFHSFGFFVFFWCVFGVFWRLRSNRLRNEWLVIASCVFYGAWNPWLVLLILFTATVDYLIALRLMVTSDPCLRRVLLAISVVVSLSLLATFKYANFLAASAVHAMAFLGLAVESPTWNIILPLGISFYTFETISYVVDVYRGRIPAARSIVDYALYIMFFPHLIAGPIVRPGYFLPQVRRTKRFHWARLQWGAQLFLRGLFKKAVLADHLAAIVDPVFAAPGEYSAGMIWLAVLCYAVQIYCDFSGYSDMAIGTAHAFGFKLPRNFNLPFLAQSIGEFWRRWHITLSTWLRDYLYIPLGGSRHGRARTYLNVVLTFTLCGLWHGAGWNYVLFGLYHGIIVSLERAFPPSGWMASPLWQPFRIARTLLLWCIGLVLFRAPDLETAWLIMQQAAAPLGGRNLEPSLVWLGVLAIALIAAGHLMAARVDLNRWAERWPPAAAGVAMGVFFLLIQVLMPAEGTPFVYFQF